MSRREPVPADVLCVTVEHRATATVVQVRGEVDLFTAPLLVSSLQDALQLSSQAVTVDLTAVTFLGSSGLAALVEGLDEAQRRRCQLRLAGIGNAVMVPLHAAGLADSFDVEPG